MHGNGTFFDPRLNDPVQFPVAAKAGSGNTRSATDQITSKLAALHFYQLAIPAPKSGLEQPFNFAARRGGLIFSGKAQCASCHVPPLYTEPGYNMHTPAELCLDDFQANRAPDKRYRTAPRRAAGGPLCAHQFAHTKGGFFHDGRFSTLSQVVDHYDGCKSLDLTSQEKSDLVAYLMTL